ncbi:MAG: VCBS repeat-containing protein [Oscillospiraceae bacterium]|nr:VCBS repeat-containing protein [Oscillospiraceae bacterium]
MFKKFLIFILNVALVLCGFSGCTEDEIAPSGDNGDSADNEKNEDNGGTIAAQPADREDQNAIGFPTWRGDWQHSGLLGGIKGEITAPKIAWYYDVTGMQNIFKVDDTATGSGVAEIAETLSDNGDWAAGMAVNEGFGDSVLIHGREGYFLPGVSEIQKIECDTGFAMDPENLHMRFFVGGELRWETEKIPLMYSALPIIGDFDGDGRVEVAILPWYDCHVYDLETGELKYKTTFMPKGAQHGRAYGYFAAYDIDGDGKQELFIIPNVGHMEMLGWEDGELVVKWSWFFEVNVGQTDTLTHVLENPLIDIDGDGKLELVTAVYNMNGDEKWHTYIVDAQTGDIMLDIVDQYIYDAVDMDRDGVWELVMMEAVSGKQINLRGNMSIISFLGGDVGKYEYTELWSQKSAVFSTRPRMYEGDNVNCQYYDNVAPVRYAKKSDGKLVFSTTVYDDENETDGTLYIWEHAEGKIEKRCEIKGKRLLMIGNITTAPMIVSSVAGGDSPNLAYEGYIIEASSQRKVVPEYSGVTIGRFMPGEALCAVVEGALDTTMVFTVNDDLSAKQGKAIASFPGRSMYSGMLSMSGYNMRRGHIELADLDGDGYVEAISAWISPNGNAELRAVNYNGETVWKHELERVPIGRPEWNNGGICYWAVGEFVEKGKLDVFITYRYDNAPSGRVVDGKTGEIIWDRLTNDAGFIVGGCMP